MSDASNVTAAKPKVGGGAWVAPEGTTAPVDASTALAQAFKSLGYISEDGLTNNNSPSSTDVKSWGGDIVLSLTTERPDKFKFKLLEAKNPEVLKVVFGDDNVEVDSSTGLIKISANAKELPRKSWSFETILDAQTLKRMYLPSAKVTSVSEIKYSDKDPIGYEVEISAFPDADGNTHYEYIE